MVRNRVRTTEKGKWKFEDLGRAVELVKSGQSLRKAAKSCSIPFSTLQERLKKSNLSVGPRLGMKSTFTAEQEQLMAKRLLQLSDVFYGVTPSILRRVAYQFAEKLGVAHRFQGGKAGVEWFRSFTRRNPQITVRRPEATSINRVTAFNRNEVNKFFENLLHLMAKYSFGPMNVYNIDETGISNVQVPQPIIAEKGKKRVGGITSGERGRTVTVICAMSAGGQYIPPMFIYPRKRMSPHLAQDGPPCSIYHCSDNGWTNEDLFVVWLKHFKDHCGASTENPVLLILDNHSSHTSMNAYDYCRDNGIIMLSIPPHTSHRLQPLDVVFYGPLKKAFNIEADLFMRSRSLQAITHYDLAKIFNAAYSRIATVGLPTSGFKATGIYPVNPNVFTDLDFQAADVLLEMSTPAIGTEDDCRGNVAGRHAELELISAQSDDHCPLPGLPTSLTTPVRQGILSNPTISSPAASQIEEFLPFPSTSATSSLKRQSSMKQHSEILTSTPRKVILIEKLQKKLKAQEKKESIRSKKKLLLSFEPLQEAGMTRKTIRPGVQQKKKELKKKTVKKRGRRTKLSSDESTDDTSSYDTDDLCDDDDMDLDHSESMNRDICFICRDSFEADNLTWQCSGCKQFAHILCAMGTPDNNQCELCSQFNPL